MRHFANGDTALIGGQQFRVERGRKGANDLVLKTAIPASLDPTCYCGRPISIWVPHTMPQAFYVVDFYKENEDYLYPNAKGGGMFMEALEHAKTEGWEAARDVLQRQKDAKGRCRR